MHPCTTNQKLRRLWPYSSNNLGGWCRHTYSSIWRIQILKNYHNLSSDIDYLTCVTCRINFHANICLFFNFSTFFIFLFILVLKKWGYHRLVLKSPPKEAFMAVKHFGEYNIMLMQQCTHNIWNGLLPVLMQYWVLRHWYRFLKWAVHHHNCKN